VVRAGAAAEVDCCPVVGCIIFKHLPMNNIMNAYRSPLQSESHSDGFQNMVVDLMWVGYLSDLQCIDVSLFPKAFQTTNNAHIGVGLDIIPPPVVFAIRVRNPVTRLGTSCPVFEGNDKIRRVRSHIDNLSNDGDLERSSARE